MRRDRSTTLDFPPGTATLTNVKIAYGMSPVRMGAALLLLGAVFGLGSDAWANGALPSKLGGRRIPAKVVVEPTPTYYSLCLISNPKHNEQLTVNYIVISLSEQRLFAYHGPMIISWSDVSTGMPGRETPVGSYRVSQKDVDHYSSIYNKAPMPYFMRLTDDGVGMHAGHLPGYAASHGCIRLPYAMAQELYHHVAPGTPVDIVPGPVEFKPSFAKETKSTPKASV